MNESEAPARREDKVTPDERSAAIWERNRANYTRLQERYGENVPDPWELA